MLKGFLNKIALATVVTGSLFVAACSSSSSSSSGGSGGGSAPGVVTAIVRSAVSGAGNKVIKIDASKELNGIGLTTGIDTGFRNATDNTTANATKRYVVSLMDTTASTPVIVSTIAAVADSGSTAHSPVSKLTITTDTATFVAGNKYSLSITDTKGKYVVTVPNFAGTLASPVSIVNTGNTGNLLTIEATATTPMDPKTGKGVFTITAKMVNSDAATNLVTVDAFDAYIVDAGGELVAIPAFTVEATDTAPTTTHASASILTWKDVTLTDVNQYFLVLGDSSGKYSFAPGAVTDASLTKSGTRNVTIENISNNGFTLSFDKPVSGLRGGRFTEANTSGNKTTLGLIDEDGTLTAISGTSHVVLQEPVKNKKLTFVASPTSFFSGKLSLKFIDKDGLITAIKTVALPVVDISKAATTFDVPRTDVIFSLAKKPAPTKDSFYIALSPRVVPMCDLVGTQSCELYPATVSDADIISNNSTATIAASYAIDGKGLKVTAAGEFTDAKNTVAKGYKFIARYTGAAQALTTFAPSPLVINLPKLNPSVVTFTWGTPTVIATNKATMDIPVVHTPRNSIIPAGIKGKTFKCTVTKKPKRGTDISGSTCAFDSSGTNLRVTFKNTASGSVSVASGDNLSVQLVKKSIRVPKGADFSDLTKKKNKLSILVP